MSEETPRQRRVRKVHEKAEKERKSVEDWIKDEAEKGKYSPTPDLIRYRFDVQLAPFEKTRDEAAAEAREAQTRIERLEKQLATFSHPQVGPISTEFQKRMEHQKQTITEELNHQKRIHSRAQGIQKTYKELIETLEKDCENAIQRSTRSKMKSWSRKRSKSRSKSKLKRRIKSKRLKSKSRRTSKSKSTRRIKSKRSRSRRR